jgi:molybdate transport system substrate-binding protein
MKKRIGLILTLCLLVVFSLAGCSSSTSSQTGTITVAAASSLKNCLDDKVISAFNAKYPNIKVQTTYDSSGKLQTQIEQGASVDVFMSAAMKQMTALDGEGLITKDSIVQLLENKIVLIVPANSTLGLTAFADIVKADKIAIGDPASVPAGQYGKEALTNLKLWDQVSAKASLGTNVTEVLNWVAEGSADAGIVYKTDAASNIKVKVVAEAPADSVSKVIYPVGIVKATKNADAAKAFAEFLKTDEALKIFESYGFTANK